MSASTPPRPDAAGDATVHDVARMAGVSAMTVSRVINGRASVSAVTRNKVEAAITALRYQPNLAARAARTGTLRIGLLYSNPSAAFLSEFLVGAMDQCRQGGGQLLLERCDDLASQRSAIACLVEAGVDGILVPPPLCDSTEVLAQLNQMGVPAIAVATARPAPGVSAVRIDDYQGALAMTQYLIAQGHRDIGFIEGDPAHTPALLRRQAFEDAMRDAGLKVDARRLAQGYFTYRSGLDAARELLGADTLPTAIFASNDDMAAATLAVAHGMGLQVPQQLSVCGFDNTPVATTVWPELTTIHQPIADMARAAVQLVIDEIRQRRAGETAATTHQLMEFTLMVRASSGVAP
ncbi:MULTISPECIES: LacI family DNA-binding transcriptional regulator [unclassified Janthinobacterium]|uniref:LacI family DNA-binding transcriptional regulator n=1 Tax=unclassified Janthinobacterium TaxID=2610881 RepID=UPI0016110684|nr:MULTISPECIES: LacI family DNA-binding transcriptional regulator [unclassified Janthinobacterium]MBB5366706.1 LacI family transcriptional regulator [Janthinobacterium sp. K2C7]MBB5380816.1 LacI family transcriptional regulator [Janthinobacterium sp. K2Li3]MBB5385088.1 LacI family transcriptional regulator [Janthinobacterium sp. K2E3]